MENRCENCIIRQLNSLKALKKDELKNISDRKQTIKIKKGELIFNENQTINGLYCIKKGVTKLSKISDNGKTQTLKLINKGDILGQRLLLSKERTNLSAEAVSDVEVCFIPRSSIEKPLETNIEYNKELVGFLAKSLKSADDDIVNMAQKSILERLAHILLHIETNFGVDNEGFLNLALTREDYANLIGTVKESCIRNFSKLKERNLIELKGRQIKLINKDALKQLEQGF